MSAEDYLKATNYQKLKDVLEDMKLILNDKVCDKLHSLVNNYVEDMRKEITDKVVSPELQVLEPMLLSYRRLTVDASRGHGPGGKMELDAIIKQIKESYGKL